MAPTVHTPRTRVLDIRRRDWATTFRGARPSRRLFPPLPHPRYHRRGTAASPAALAYRRPAGLIAVPTPSLRVARVSGPAREQMRLLDLYERAVPKPLNVRSHTLPARREGTLTTETGINTTAAVDGCRPAVPTRAK